MSVETERFILRDYSLDDLTDHVEIMGNWQVTQWLSNNITFPYTRAAGKDFIENAISGNLHGKSLTFAVIDKQTHQLMGGIKIFSVTGDAEIGYWLGEKFWGKGAGTEILKAMIGHVFTNFKITNLLAQTSVDNTGSRAVLKKVGFQEISDFPKQMMRAGCGEKAGDVPNSAFYRLKKQDYK